VQNSITFTQKKLTSRVKLFGDPFRHQRPGTHPNPLSQERAPACRFSDKLVKGVVQGR
jgi:hypothetical protein